MFISKRVDINIMIFEFLKDKHHSTINTTIRLYYGHITVISDGVSPGRYDFRPRQVRSILGCKDILCIQSRSVCNLLSYQVCELDMQFLGSRFSGGYLNFTQYVVEQERNAFPSNPGMPSQTKGVGVVDARYQ